jgi:ribosomal protein S18 acetylase RimI-like enzyme
MSVLIRRGAASDIQFLAWVMFAASRSHLARGLWDLIIGADEPGCHDYLRRLAVAEPRSLYHYQSFFVAEIDGTPAAALCGFEMREVWELAGQAMANVEHDLGWTEEDAAASYQRLAPIWTACMPADIGADYVIESVATLPEYRRRGLIQALIAEALRSASQLGCKLAQISTYLGNHSALQAYKKSGFRVQDEKRCEQLEKILGVPGFIRLTREVKND